MSILTGYKASLHSLGLLLFSQKTFEVLKLKCLHASNSELQVGLLNSDYNRIAHPNFKVKHLITCHFCSLKSLKKVYITEFQYN